MKLMKQFNVRCVVTADGQILCSGEKMSKGASKARAQLAHSTGAKLQWPSAIHERMLYCTQTSFFAFRATSDLYPFLQIFSHPTLTYWYRGTWYRGNLLGTVASWQRVHVLSLSVPTLQTCSATLSSLGTTRGTTI